MYKQILIGWIDCNDADFLVHIARLQVFTGMFFESREKTLIKKENPNSRNGRTAEISMREFQTSRRILMLAHLAALAQGFATCRYLGDLVLILEALDFLRRPTRSYNT